MAKSPDAIRIRNNFSLVIIIFRSQNDNLQFSPLSLVSQSSKFKYIRVEQVIFKVTMKLSLSLSLSASETLYISHKSNEDD